MTRIIGGTAGGRRLKTPAGDGTRPTSDRVREALFSALESALGSLHGLRVLDLYAGTGAIGLEAISRGASAVTLVESDRRTARLITENAATLGFPVEVVNQPVNRVLARGPRSPYDIVFADPPYPLPDEDLDATLVTMITNGWLSETGILVVERSARSVEPTWPAPLQVDRVKEYGETVLWYAHPKGS